MSFENDIFPLPKVSQHKKPKDGKHAFSNKLVDEKNMNMESLQKHFKFQMPSLILKSLYGIDDKKKNNKLVYMIKSELSDLKDEIEKISEND